MRGWCADPSYQEVPVDTDDVSIESASIDADAIPSAVAAEFTGLARSLMHADTVGGVLATVVHAAVRVLPGADFASITLRADRGFTTPVQTDGLAVHLDELQYRLGEGPCVAATLADGLGLTYCRDLVDGACFGRWGPAAAELGVGSVLSVGLFPGDDPTYDGALNVYSRTRSGLDERDRELALVLAAHASTALVGVRATSAADLESAQLRQALQSRDVIGQAKGILMERRGISSDEAFAVLRSASQSLNIKLAQVAQTLVERRSEI